MVVVPLRVAPAETGGLPYNSTASELPTGLRDVDELLIGGTRCPHGTTETDWLVVLNQFLPHNPYVAWCFDADAGSITADGQHRYDDIVSDHNSLSDAS